MVAGALHAKKDSDSSHTYKLNYDSQLLPLPIASPPCDDLFIDDTSDVDVNDQYVIFCDIVLSFLYSTRNTLYLIACL